MAYRFVIVALSVIVLSNQANAANCFVRAPGFPPELLAALVANAPPSSPLVTLRKPARHLPAYRQPCFEKPVSVPPALPQQPLPLPGAIPCSSPTAKANGGTYFVPEPGFPSGLLETLIANAPPSSPLAALKKSSPNLSILALAQPAPAPAPYHAIPPSAPPAVIPPPPVATPIPTPTVPAVTPGLTCPLAKASTANFPPALIQALQTLIAYCSTYSAPKTDSSSTPAAPVAPAAPAPPPVPASPPAAAACPAAASKSLDPALVQLLLKNLVVTSEVCPCSCSKN